MLTARGNAIGEGFGWLSVNATDAGIVGKRLANAALILATGVAIASIIASIGVAVG